MYTDEKNRRGTHPVQGHMIDERGRRIPDFMLTDVERNEAAAEWVRIQFRRIAMVAERNADIWTRRAEAARKMAR